MCKEDQSVSNNEDFYIFFNGFSVQAGLNTNMLKSFECSVPIWTAVCELKKLINIETMNSLSIKAELYFSHLYLCKRPSTVVISDQKASITESETGHHCGEVVNSWQSVVKNRRSKKETDRS